MEHVPTFDAVALSRLSKAIQKAAQGQPVSFSFNGGMHREYMDGVAIEVPNGTMTITILVKGGARDTGEPLREPCEVGESPTYWGDMKGRPEYVPHEG